ncbi:MAG: PD-(D/E)XK nuclease family protein [Candidatus Niyogibacteria bacterium]|nr:PD-(D/E)XK nuclease family protein [Candidatus Niyogibacteria bacterium]
MRTSYSVLDTYKTCPQKYKFQEIDKLKTPKSREAVFGSSVHEALQYMFTRNPLFPTLDEVVNAFRERWAARSANIKWKDGEAAAFIDEGVDILKKFYAHNQPWNYDVLDMESRFSLELEDTDHGVTHTIAGVVDRIDKLEDGSYEIIDYKTARRMPSQAALDENLQMSIYHLALVGRWPHLKDKPIKLSLYFVKHGEKLTTVRDAKSLAATKSAVLGTINEIETKTAQNNFPPNPGPLCDWCGYKKICPMWKHFYKKRDVTNEEIKIAVADYFKFKNESDLAAKNIKKLQPIIHEYLSKHELGRIFGDEGYITRTVKTQPIFDLEKLQPVLETAGLWAEVLKVDDRKLVKAVSSLPAEIRAKVLEGALTGEKETKTLTVTRKKLTEPEEE